jgi:hypothetical protein
MDISLLNKFIEPTEQMRIKSGILQSAVFKIKVDSGYASGTVNAEYKDLSIISFNSKTGSEDGILDKISSFVGKIFVVRKNNIPDEAGNLKTGKVDYIHKPDEPFTQYVWFALRSGLGDVVGF